LLSIQYVFRDQTPDIEAKFQGIYLSEEEYEKELEEDEWEPAPLPKVATGKFAFANSL
jgi:hypothetical protein